MSNNAFNIKFTNPFNVFKTRYPKLFPRPTAYARISTADRKKV